MADERRPSEVFFALWYHRMTHGDPVKPDNFELCAETWAEIRRLEAEDRWERIRTMTEPSTEEIREALKASEIRAMRSFWAPGEGDKAEPPQETAPEVTPEAEEAAPVKLAGPYSSIKNEILARLEAARAAGVTVGQIAAASNGDLTPDNVLDLLCRKKKAMSVWDACDLALKALGWTEAAT